MNGAHNIEKLSGRSGHSHVDRVIFELRGERHEVARLNGCERLEFYTFNEDGIAMFRGYLDEGCLAFELRMIAHDVFHSCFEFRPIPGSLADQLRSAS